MAFNHQIHSKPCLDFIVTAFKKFLFETYEVEVSKQEDIEEWSSFIMSSKEVIQDPPTVVHSSIKGKTVTSPQISALHPSNSESVSQPILKQAKQNVVDLSSETSPPDNLRLLYNLRLLAHFYTLIPCKRHLLSSRVTRYLITGLIHFSMLS